MPLLSVIQDESAWLRQYRRAISIWCGHVAEEMAVASAAVYTSAALRGVSEANCVLGTLGAADLQIALNYFTQASAAPLAWYLAEGDAALPGLRDAPVGIWHLNRLEHSFPQTHPDLTIIPARASFPHVGEIAPAMRPDCPPEQAVEAAVSHLDDPRIDALLVLRGGKAVGYATVLSTGEAGFVMDYFVHSESRSRGYESPLTGRMLDICARSGFRDVYWPIPADDAAGQKYAAEIGFAHLGDVPHKRRA